MLGTNPATFLLTTIILAQLLLITTPTPSPPPSTLPTIPILPTLSTVTTKLSLFSQKPPLYTLTKISYTNLTKSQQKNLQKCDLSQKNSYQVIPSVNIHEGDSISYPVIVRYCDQFYTINGYHLIGFSSCTDQGKDKCRYFVSSARNQFTYFGQVQWKQGSDSTAIIKKLQSRNKKVFIEQQATISIPSHYGEVTSFINSFSLSLKLFAFSTSKNYILFYRLDGTLESALNLRAQHQSVITYRHPSQKQQEETYSNLKMIKLNNQIVIHTLDLNKNSLLSTISTNGKNTTLKKFTIPKFQPSEGEIIELKYNDNHWNEFYVKIQDRVYVYDQTQKGNNIMPRLWYPLLGKHDEFYVAGSMLIAESHLGKKDKEPMRIYYNMTETFVGEFFIPQLFCPHPTHISTTSQGHGIQILCTFCNYSFQCYSLFSNTDPNFLSKNQYTDYSKFRVPLVLISLGIVIFISVTRGKKNNQKTSFNQEKQQEMFMNELQKKDKKLYEQLKRSRKDRKTTDQRMERED